MCKDLPDYILFAACQRHGVRCRSYEEIYDPSTGQLRPEMLAKVPPYALTQSRLTSTQSPGSTSSSSP
jgi:hypothetical protein